MAMGRIVHAIDQGDQRRFECAPIGDQRLQTEDVSTKVPDDSLYIRYASAQLRGDLLVALGQETLTALQPEAKSKKGLDSAVVQVLGHPLALLAQRKGPALAFCPE